MDKLNQEADLKLAYIFSLHVWNHPDQRFPLAGLNISVLNLAFIIDWRVVCTHIPSSTKMFAKRTHATQSSITWDFLLQCFFICLLYFRHSQTAAVDLANTPLLFASTDPCNTKKRGRQGMTSSHLCTNRVLKPELCACLMLVTQWLIWVIPRVTCFGPLQHLERWRFGSLTRTAQGWTTNPASLLNFYGFVFKYQSFVKKKVNQIVSQQAVTAHFQHI